MAVHKSFTGLGAAIVQISKNVEENISIVVRKAALTADIVVVTESPVDTGLFRSRWIVTIGQPAEVPTGLVKKLKESISKGEATSISIEQGKKKIFAWKIGDGSIFINNPLPYGPFLDAGGSSQAAMGMTADAIQAAQQVLKTAKLLRKK